MAKEAVQIADTAAHPSSVLIARFALGPRGCAARTCGPRHLEPRTALAICRELGLPFYIHYVAPPLAVAYGYSETAGRGREPTRRQRLEQDPRWVSSVIAP